MGKNSRRQSALEWARLSAPKGFHQALKAASKNLALFDRDTLSPAAAWLTDNARGLHQKAHALEDAVRRAPKLPARDGQPEVFFLAEKMADSATILHADDVLSLAREFQTSVRPLLEEELAALPDALTSVYLSRALKACQACGAEALAALNARKVLKRVQKGNFSRLPDDRGTAAALKKLLAAAGDRRTLSLLDAHLEKRELKQEATNADEALRILRSCVLSLRALTHIKFEQLNEKLSVVCQILAQDKTFPRMDRKSRDLYRGRVAFLSKRYHLSQEGVARAAIALSRGGAGLTAQAGYYLLEAPALILRSLGRRARVPNALKRERRFIALPLLVFLLSLMAGILLSLPFYVCAALPFCVSELFHQLYYRILRKKYPARPLPRLLLPRIPKDRRTLVVVPTLLINKAQALSMVRHLSVLRSLSPEQNLDFMLLGDLKDSGARVDPKDIDLTHASLDAVRALNEVYGDVFSLLIRQREFSKSEGRYMGRERKRGALETLLKLICGESASDSFCASSIDIDGLAGKYAYVITLDADTLLLAGDARRLIGTLEHPLQKGRVGVVQPVMRVFPGTVKTGAQRFLGGSSGLPAYAMDAQDIYQDVFGRGSFVGKGIIDPALFLDALKGRVQEERVLSHDLLEGEFAHSALASDIALLDGHPMRLAGFYKRLHRWTRGDWQLLPYLFDKTLSPLSRYKMLDNLRRSLVPLARVTLLLSGAGLGLLGLVLLSLPYPLRGLWLRLWFLPVKAYTCLDAAIRAVFRMTVSHRHLLSWVTAQETESSAAQPFAPALFQVVTGGALVLLSFLPATGIGLMVLVGLYLVVLPLFVPLFDGEKKGRALTKEQTDELMKLARDTLSFFEETVNEGTHFLPPDNLQLEPERGVAMRTSPTNIGLYLASLCAAKILGFMDADELARRVRPTILTLEALKKYEGHLYNWYDLNTLEPLEPLFVSSVDEGNLAACLLLCAQALRKELSQLDLSLRDLPRRIDGLFTKMRFELLYDREDGLFSIGLNADTGKLTEGRYDLLASEALLLSYVAVMSGQAPTAHLRRLGKPMTRAGGGPVLLSWGGTMFEYLMPCLLLPLYPNTLLSTTARRVVRSQRNFHPLRPFGVSESGYYAFDEKLNYQYRAFGLPQLALAPGTDGEVVAPYASMLTLLVNKRQAADNLTVLKRLNAYGALGLYEALDYSKKRTANPPARVVSHMAHHQGMIMCAVCNALTDGALIDLFSSLPAAQAYQYLLCEEAPRRGKRLPPPPTPVHMTQDAPAPREIEKGASELILLSAEGMTWGMDGQGQGFLKNETLFLTRFDEGASPRFGFQLYLRDKRRNTFFSIAAKARAVVEPGSVSYLSGVNALKVTETRFITPMEGAAVSLVTLQNGGDEDMKVELVSFLEPTISTLNDDLAHPNFRDLFVSVEKVSARAIAAKRRARTEKEHPPILLHYFLGAAEEIALQGDRALFLGREGSYEAPAQLQMNQEEATMRLGATVMPCLSIRAQLLLKPKSETRVAFITCVCKDEAEADRALRFFVGTGDLRGALTLSATQAQLLQKSLKLDASLLPAAFRLLSALLLPRQRLMPAAPKEALWAHGVSGDRPILLVLVPSGQDVQRVDAVLKFHAFFAFCGVIVDLVFLCKESEGYDSASEGSVRALASLSAAPRDALFILPKNAETERVFQASARVTLSLMEPLTDFAPPLLSPPAFKKPMNLLPPALPSYRDMNTYGGFSGERGFLVTRPAPQPWCNFLCTERFGTLVCETGILYTCLDNSRMRRLTRRPLSVLTPAVSEEITLVAPNGTTYDCARGAALHEPGVTTYFEKTDAFETELSVFTDAEFEAGARVLTVRSLSAEPLELELSYLVHFAMGEAPEQTFVSDGNAFVRALHPAFDGAAYACVKGAQAHEGALRLPFSLAPEHQIQIPLLLIYAKEEGMMEQIRHGLLDHGISARIRLTRKVWEERLSRLEVRLPNEGVEKLMNTFLPYQTRAARLYMRAGLYQPGGAFGFRDQLQDMLTFLLTDEALVRRYLLLFARHQFEEGDVQHWWHAPRTGVRTRITDDMLFLPYLTAQYVFVTGDESVLEEQIPYLKADPLADGEDDRYFTPEESEKTDSLRAHCMKAIDSVRFGAHGLPLMGGGDWNDGMNEVGGKKGESVWLAFFLCVTLAAFAPMSHEEERLDALRRKILHSSGAAFHEPWYLRAWFDDGRTLGAKDSEVPRIDLISQCFAVLAGAPRDRAEMAVNAALDRLFDRQAGVFKLLDPPIAFEEGAGYIGAYLPGVRENGGQYTHAVPWMILALLRLNRVKDAWDVFLAILPPAHSDSKEKAERYKLEPYVLSADVYAGENEGRGGWSWYTGSAAWLYYVFFTGLMGVTKHGDKLRFAPCLPDEMDECMVVYRYKDTTYELIADKETRRVTLDGERLEDGFVRLVDDGRTHTLRCGART